MAEQKDIVATFTTFSIEFDYEDIGNGVTVPVVTSIHVSDEAQEPGEQGAMPGGMGMMMSNKGEMT